MAPIAIPSVGIAMEEALLVKWLKQPGDRVAAAEPVAEIETDKATMELESPVDGILGEHLVEPGAVVPVGTVIAEVGPPGAPVEAAAPAEAVPEAAAATDGGAPVPAPVVAAEPVPAEPVPAEPVPAEPVPGARRPHRMSPRARRLAREQAQAACPEPVSAPEGRERFRELIAAKVSQSWREIPHFAVTREIDAEPLLAAVAALRARGVEPPPTATDLLLRALAVALRAVDPAASGDVGLAVATEHGVVIPVVRAVTSLDPAGLARARAAAVDRARSGRLSADDLAASPPSTLSNLGSLGVDHFTGVIALGQTSLLTTGRALPRAVVGRDGGLKARTTFHATLNVDHRRLDGAGAARLLVAFADAAEKTTADFQEER